MQCTLNDIIVLEMGIQWECQSVPTPGFNLAHVSPSLDADLGIDRAIDIGELNKSKSCEGLGQ